MLQNPQGEYAKACVRAMARVFDRVVRTEHYASSSSGNVVLHPETGEPLIDQVAADIAGFGELTVDSVREMLPNGLGLLDNLWTSKPADETPEEWYKRSDVGRANMLYSAAWDVSVRINPEVKDLFGFRYEDFQLEGYDPHPAIRAPIAV
jgi:hypothetical protein